MNKKPYNTPSMNVYGSMSSLTQVLGLADGDFINNVDNNDTGSVSLTCNFAANPVTCVEDPNGGAP